MKLYKTQRGFKRGDFLDRYAAKCSIQESSLAQEECIWLGVDISREGKESDRMHLTRELAKELIPLLKKFVDTGHL